jgi:hypothetical protein
MYPDVRKTVRGGWESERGWQTRSGIIGRRKHLPSE